MNTSHSSNERKVETVPSVPSDLPTLDDLDDVVRLVQQIPDLYVRWSRGPGVDLHTTSVDDLTGVELPGPQRECAGGRALVG